MHFPDEPTLDQHLSSPSPRLIEEIRAVRSPLLVLGAGGKMGPTLAVMARRAAAEAGHPLEVMAVSRFQNPAARAWLEAQGVRTVVADLLEEDQVRALPEAGDLAYLVGMKFGTATDPSATWVANTLVPAHVTRRFAGTRMVALSTGNVYPFVPVDGAPATEAHALTPLGEYANAAVGRERVLQWASARYQSPMVLVRLSYAVEARYGVLHDIAARLQREEPVPLENGWFNCIWQRDAHDAILRLFQHATCPPLAVNLTGTGVVGVRDAATALGKALDREPVFQGQETSTALLSDVSRMVSLVGAPPTSLEEMLESTASWIRTGGRSLGKPTRFEVKSGRY
ncbi:MAG: NAD(P)-dependent oxidoreductase [Verrucomicrobiales bacterium]|nr:NAD(P)-dependent oxidoreductase [Verrucomicrobiales bacterium]